MYYFNQATTIIKKLHDVNKQLLNEKSALLLDKKNKASNVFKLISQLPPKERYEESKKLMSVMNSTEPIEIVDSDEEKKGRSEKVCKEYNRNITISNVFNVATFNRLFNRKFILLTDI